MKVRFRWLLPIVAILVDTGVCPAQKRLPTDVPVRAPVRQTAPRHATIAERVRSLASASRDLQPTSELRLDGTLRHAYGILSRPYQGTPESAARSFVADNLDLFGPGDPAEFEVSKTITIAAYTFVRLQQTVDGIPVHGKELVLTMDQNHSVQSIAANYTAARLRRGAWVLEAEQAAAAALDRASGSYKRSLRQQRVWFDEQGQLTPAWSTIVESREENGAPSPWLYVVDAASGEILEEQDLRQGQSARTAAASVFPTNPVEGSLTPVTLNRLDPATPYLYGSNVKIFSNLRVLAGLDAPGTVKALATPDANGAYPYLPGDPRQGEVQLYWGMDRAAESFKSIGFPGLDAPLPGVTEFAQCDSNGCTQVNNAFFNPTSFDSGGIFICYNPFGELADDTDVVLHEYTHAVVGNIVGYPQGKTFGALNEGTADYFSDSFQDDPISGEYAARLFGVRLPYIRRADNANVFPINLAGEIHMDGNIWSGALWDLRKQLGPANTDLAVLLTIASIPATAEFYDAANAVVNVTALLYGHKASDAARNIFTKRGLLSWSAELAANTILLRAFALPVVDSIQASGPDGLLADRQFRFSVPRGATSLNIKITGNSNLIALLKYRSPPVVYDDGTSNADSVSDLTSPVTFKIDQLSDPEIQSGDYYLWVAHFNQNDSTEYAVTLAFSVASGSSLSSPRFTALTANGPLVSGSVTPGLQLNSREFLVAVPSNATAMGIELDGDTDVDLYVSNNRLISFNGQGYPESDALSASPDSTEVVILTSTTIPALAKGPYIVGVYNYDVTQSAHFKLTAAATSTTPARVTLANLAARTTATLQIPRGYGAAQLANTELAVTVPAGSSGLRLNISTTLNATVYIRQGSPIAFSNGFPVADYAFTSDQKTFDITTSMSTPLKAGTYYVWIANKSPQDGSVTFSYSLF